MIDMTIRFSREDTSRYQQILRVLGFLNLVQFAQIARFILFVAEASA